jgi:hypothetical protein
MTTLRNLAILTVALAGAALGESPFAGTWQGKMNGLPAVTLTISDENGKLSGSVDFYLLSRPTENDPWRVDGKATEALIAPKVDGKVLSFEVRHHINHNSREYGPNVAMRLELLENDKAKLGDVVLTREK